MVHIPVTSMMVFHGTFFAIISLRSPRLSRASTITPRVHTVWMQNIAASLFVNAVGMTVLRKIGITISMMAAIIIQKVLRCSGEKSSGFSTSIALACSSLFLNTPCLALKTMRAMR